MKKIKWKKILIIFGVIFLGFIVLNIIAAPIAYDIAFGSNHDMNFENKAGIVDYNEYKDIHKREEITYESEEHKLNGYSYLENDTDYLVVTVHGIKDYADYLLPEIFYFLDNGYNVFSFDASGCGKSEGSVNGFSQELIDLESTLKFLNQDTRFKDYKKLLFGFSAGGYAVASVPRLVNENVIGIVTISGYDNAEDLIADKGFEYVGILAFFGKPLVWIKEKSIFRDYLSIRATDVINETNIPYFIAHAHRDALITYKKLDILSKCTKEKDVFKYDEAASHSGILYSVEARDYQREVNNELEKISDTEKKEYLNTVNDALYSEVNKELFPKILDFFSYCKTK